MIPSNIEEHLRQCHARFGHGTHLPTVTAQALAAAEHVSGKRVAKAVIVRLDGQLAIAVVSAADRVSLPVLEEATGATADLAMEQEFAETFWPCEPGAEPPLGIFGLPIFVDDRLTQMDTIVMSGGTHEDAIELDTREWMRCESARPIPGLGMPTH
jgi:Ala-tRNA(Pro) deacylase